MASTLGGTPVDETPADAAAAGIDAAPPEPLAETVGAGGVGVPLGRSEPKAARFPGGGAAAIIGAGVPDDAAGGGEAD
ncbi:hypothetical protein CQY20_00135 [Mycolicibacterium agri]|uniref:Uncharacterized protein n=1 Tax=Mycolicibacterium agri TaxID=36811 RepID=A0A2A7NHX3_MYCAG|nr:hypothetical protein CQY20_00135 [Mycolicibacterium agri]